MKNIRIDFVSDVACPWCAIGLGFLEKALIELKEEVKVEIYFQPFELNPDMPEGGQDTIAHLVHKYGSSPEQIKQNQEQIKQRASQAGFEFHANVRPFVYNTFTCHRLIHWAGLVDGVFGQYRMKKELLKAYFTLNENLDDSKVLLEAVSRAGLDTEQAKEIIGSDLYADEVREAQTYFQKLGISAVPSIIFNKKYLVQGGQPTEVFVKMMREIASEKS